MGLANDTVLRTPTGTITVGQLRVGDTLLDHRNQPVLVLAVSDTGAGRLHRLKFQMYGTGSHSTEENWERIYMTQGHHIAYVQSFNLISTAKSANDPTEAKRVVRWATRCVPGGVEQYWREEANELQDEQDEMDMAGPNPSQESIVSDHSAAAVGTADDDAEDAALPGEEPDDLDDPAPAQLAQHLLSSPPAAQNAQPHIAFQLPMHADDDGQLPEHEDPDESAGDLSYAPSSQESSLSNISDLSSVHVRSLMSRGLRGLVRHMQKEKLSDAACDCGGFRMLSLSTESEDDANLIAAILKSNHSHMVDPFAISKGDTGEITVKEYRDSTHWTETEEPNRRVAIKVFRCPLQVEQGDNTITNTLVIPPWLIGFFLGDGCKGSMRVVTADREVLVYMQGLVDRMNNSRPEWAAPMEVRTYLSSARGDWIPGLGCYAAVDTYYHVIVSSAHRQSPAYWNPLRQALADLGIINDKSGGVPALYRNGPPDVRRAVLAGLIDSDGCFDGSRSQNAYIFTQRTEEHRNIALHAHQLALSLGVSSTFNETMRPLHNSHTLAPYYIVYISGPGIKQLQPFILCPRKHMKEDHYWQNIDVRPFGIKRQNATRDYREIEVSGHLFQHETRTVLHD